MYHMTEPELAEPSMDEIELIVKSLKNNKAPEEGHINSELLKIAKPFKNPSLPYFMYLEECKNEK